MDHIGREVKLEDGAPKVRGLVKYGADLARPGQLHARLITSPHAHALVNSISLDDALAVPGVHSVITAEDLPDVPARQRSSLLLARDRVRFVGHPVALVLAESEAAAQDGADLVFVDYEIQPAVVDLEQALESEAPAVWPEGMPGQSDEAAAHGAAGGGSGNAPVASPNVTGRVQFDRGDLDRGFAEADVIVERTYRTESVHQSYLEPHVTLAEFDPMADGLTIWTSTQATHYVRDTVAAILRVPGPKVRVVGTPVGGGFGAKFVLYEPLVALAAQVAGRPVYFSMNRMEEMITATPAPATRVKIRLGAKNDGTITALDAELAMNCGVFPTSMTGLAGVLLGSAYKIPNQRIVGMEVLTHRASAGAYRAPAAPQCFFALESAVDELARRLDQDPLELRRRHASGTGDPMAIGRPWPTMGLPEVLEAVAAHDLWQRRDEVRAQGRAVGLAVGGWPGGTEPAAAACSLEGDGTLQIHIGSVDLTGTRTAFQQMAAEAFGLAPDKIRILSGDTQSAPFAGSTGGSKITYTVGRAVVQAVEDAKQQVLEMASQMLEAAVEDLEIRDGAVQVKGAPDSAMPLAKIARKTMSFGSVHAPIYGQGRHAQPEQAPGFCAQLAEISLDQDTGRIDVHRLVLIQDVGRAINPLLVRGQMQGGALQGIGWGLYEELRYDDQGQPITATLSDYALPHIAHLPEQLELEMVEVPAPHGPFGAKGVGEPPVIATAAAIANAVAELSGARLDHLPMTAPRVLEQLRLNAS